VPPGTESRRICFRIAVVSQKLGRNYGYVSGYAPNGNTEGTIFMRTRLTIRDFTQTLSISEEFPIHAFDRSRTRVNVLRRVRYSLNRPWLIGSVSTRKNQDKFRVR
jgi:hypothetical protein